ncbi:hypothetical protein ACWFMI_01180 [Nocardiopsis terrae]
MNHVCDIRELPDIDALRSWARTHHTAIGYVGPDAEGYPVYEAHRGHTTRLARGTTRDPHTHPLVWHSPLERTR